MRITFRAVRARAVDNHLDSCAILGALHRGHLRSELDLLGQIFHQISWKLIESLDNVVKTSLATESTFV